MGFRSRLRAGHCMIATSSPARKLCVFRAAWGVALSCISTNFFGKLSWPREGDFGARCQCSIAVWPCNAPLPALICLMQRKHSIPWERGRHFHLFVGLNSPLVSHHHTDELGHGHQSGEGWTWIHQQISHDTSANGSSSSVCVLIRAIGVDDHESVWGIWLDVLSDTLLPSKVFR